MIDNETFNFLSEVYSKANLEKGLMPLVKKFFLIPENKSYCKPEVDEVLQRLTNKKVVTKADMAVFCFSIFKNEEIYKRFLATLPHALQTLISELLWKESVSEEEAEILLKEPVTKDLNLPFGITYRSSQDQELRNEFYFFSVFKRNFYSYAAGNIFTLSLTPCLKRLLIKYYPKPVHYYFSPLEKIPETTFSFNAEDLIQEELQRMLSYYMQNGIKYSIKGRPSETTLNKFQKIAKIKEFYLDVPDLAGKMRSMLIAGLLYDFKIINISFDTLAVLKNLFNKHYIKQSTSQFILMYIKGWAYMGKYDYNPNAETEFLAIIKQLPIDNKWVSFENLKIGRAHV